MVGAPIMHMYGCKWELKRRSRAVRMALVLHGGQHAAGALQGGHQQKKPHQLLPPSLAHAGWVAFVVLHVLKTSYAQEMAIDASLHAGLMVFQKIEHAPRMGLGGKHQNLKRQVFVSVSHRL